MKKKKLNPLQQIDEEAKKLDREAKREWRNAVKFKDENYLLFMAFIILIAAILIVNTVYVINRSSHTTTSVSSVNDSPRVYKSLDHGANHNFSVTVANVSESDTKDPAFPLNDTQTLLTLDIKITNTSSAMQQLIPTTQLFIHDHDGNYAQLQASMHLSNPLATQDIKPGDTASGQIAFAIPKRQTRPLLYVDLGWGGDVPIVFDVLH